MLDLLDKEQRPTTDSTKGSSMKKFLACVMIVGIAGCTTQPLSEYEPVIDPYRTNMSKYDSDLNECRAVALRIEAEYKQRQQDEAGKRLVAGIIAGALVGSVVGAGSDYRGDYVRMGAVAGAAEGMSGGDYTHDLVTYGPRRIVDRCMTERGYTILNDLGRG